jgi:hypothetical protein
MSMEGGVGSAKSRKWRVMVAGLVLAVVGVLAWAVLWPGEAPEPMYQGKPLSFWLEKASTLDDTNEEATVAFRSMGTNALPILLKLMQSKPSRLEKIFDYLNKKQSLIRFPQLIAYKALCASVAIRSMGPVAKPAIPVLSNCFFETKNYGNEFDAGYALSGTGSGGVTVLLAALTNQSVGIRFRAVRALGNERSDLEIVVPALIKSLGDSRPVVRWGTANSLGDIHALPELTVPALIQNLSNSDLMFQGKVAWALGRFGDDAKAAVPELVKLLQNPDADLHEEITNALKRIDPETAAKAGVK